MNEDPKTLVKTTSSNAADIRLDNPAFFISSIWLDTGFDLPDNGAEIKRYNCNNSF
jgi:hypothetical protein